MPFVVDASVSAAWALADEASPLAEAALDRLSDDYVLVPRIWWYEIRNLLVVNERRHRITLDGSSEFLKLLSAYPIRFETAEDDADTLSLARQYRLSFYDAAYLSVALRNGCSLATLDRELRLAAMAACVPLLE